MTETTVGTDLSSGGGSTTEQVKEQVKQTAQAGAQQARGRVREQVEQRSTQAGQQLTSTADDVRTIADELRKQGKDAPARLAEQAAQRVERVGGYLSSADADTILADVEDYARKNPWAVVAGGFVLGMAASRFLKASSSRRYQSIGTTRPPRLGTEMPLQTPTLPAPPAVVTPGDTVAVDSTAGAYVEPDLADLPHYDDLTDDTRTLP